MAKFAAGAPQGMKVLRDDVAVYKRWFDFFKETKKNGFASCSVAKELYDRDGDLLQDACKNAGFVETESGYRFQKRFLLKQ
jgi:hypothetical protein